MDHKTTSTLRPQAQAGEYLDLEFNWNFTYTSNNSGYRFARNFA